MAVLLLGGTGPAVAQTGYDLPIREHVFDNGLRLLVLERPGDPRVAAKIFTDMGAIHETPGLLGAAHFQEHIMFKGTPTLGTSDWEAERPIRERMWEVEAELIEERNRARNAIRQRGVMDDYRHAESTPRMDELAARLDSLEREAARYRESGPTKRWYQAFGGTGLTATTEQEYMKFDINLPVERVDLFLRVEADRMSNTVFREFEQERMILVEQRFGDLNNPSTPYYEQMNALAGVVHPVFWPEGYPTDFYEYTRTSQRDLYEEYFVVNNTTLVFIGGVSLEEMIPRVERYFGWMEPAPEPARTPAVEPRPAAERRLVYRNEDIEPRVEFRYQIPGVGHPDRPVFDVLGEVAAARLGELLAREGIDGRVSVNTRVVHTSRFGVPGTLNLEVILADEGQLDAAEAVLEETVEWLKSPPDPGRVEHAQKVLRTDWYRTARDADALAFEIGHFQTMDRWQTLPAYLQGRDDTTPEDIARVAGTHFVPDNRSVGVARSRTERPGVSEDGS
ncbi:MAG TPA: insulinase family protein [Longimicrobiales bacterium]|nr:insulinase family protein [Longimicrobiales bacterium]